MATAGRGAVQSQDGTGARPWTSSGRRCKHRGPLCMAGRGSLGWDVLDAVYRRQGAAAQHRYFSGSFVECLAARSMVTTVQHRPSYSPDEHAQLEIARHGTRVTNAGSCGQLTTTLVSTPTPQQIAKPLLNSSSLLTFSFSLSFSLHSLRLRHQLLPGPSLRCLRRHG